MMNRQGGVYLLTLVEWFAFFPSLVVFSIMECIAVGWIYGIPRMDDVMMLMWGTRVARGMGILWKFICPALLLVIFGYSFYSYRPPQFDEYVFPGWANVIGWLISATIVLPLPAFFLWSIWKAQGETIREKLSIVCKPLGRWDISESDLKQATEMHDGELILQDGEENIVVI